MKYFYVGTALSIIQSLYKKSSCNDKGQNKAIKQIKHITINSHNEYLQKYKSIFTDKYALKPYFLDENMEKRRRQPSFIKSGSTEDVYHMRHAILSDGMAHARQLAMLRSCSGNQLRWELKTLTIKLSNISNRNMSF